MNRAVLAQPALIQSHQTGPMVSQADWAMTVDALHWAMVQEPE